MFAFPTPFDLQLNHPYLRMMASFSNLSIKVAETGTSLFSQNNTSVFSNFMTYLSSGYSWYRKLKMPDFRQLKMY